MDTKEKEITTRNFKQSRKDFFNDYDGAKAFVHEFCKNAAKVKIQRLGSRMKTEGFYVKQYERIPQKKT